MFQAKKQADKNIYITLALLKSFSGDGMKVFSPCRATGISACGTLLTLVPRCFGNRADALAALASAAPAADCSILGHAGLSAGATVTVLSCPAALTVALSTVADAMA